MANGFMGKLLNVDLTSGRMTEEPLDANICRNYVGGYGLGARLLYDRIPKGADPLGPQNVLGLLTGPLTGTPAIIGSRFVAVAKSPKTGGWGDANCGGHFGPHLKFAGFDGVLFSGISAKPVYLFIDEGRAQLLDAADLWGLGVTALEDLLVKRHGKGIQICSIGPAGEKLALSACIMNDKERAAGRSGLGAVMGAKKLKCVVVKGKMTVPVHDEQKMKDLRKQYLKQATGAFEVFRKYGTAGITHDAILSGDGPVRNWGGAGTTDFPSPRGRRISDDAVVGLDGYKAYGCWHCPIACGGKVTQKGGRFPLELNDGVGHKPEYETLAMFGSNLLNDDLASIVKVNEICNNLGMDTITVGATIAYAVECCENGLITRQQTDGLDLKWGNAAAIVALTEKIGRREGFGDVLADGVWAAWQKLGRIGTEYAVHIQGEEIPAHDPKFTPGLASTYWLTATPGRHTQGGELVAGSGSDGPRDGQIRLFRPGRGPPHSRGRRGGGQRGRPVSLRLPQLPFSGHTGSALRRHRRRVGHGTDRHDRNPDLHHAARLQPARGPQPACPQHARPHRRRAAAQGGQRQGHHRRLPHAGPRVFGAARLGPPHHGPE